MDKFRICLNLTKRKLKPLLEGQLPKKPKVSPIQPLSSNQKTLQRLTQPVLVNNPIARWEKDKYECILNLKDLERTINGKLYPTSAEEIKEFSKQIKELLAQKLIQPFASPHNSPAFFVYKRAEQKRGKARIVINYRALNNNLVPDAYKIPDKNNLIQLIDKRTWFSKFDCKSRFWQVRMHKESVP